MDNVLEIILIVVMIVVFFTTVIIMMRQMNQITKAIDQKIDKENRRTQDKIDQMNETVNLIL